LAISITGKELFDRADDRPLLTAPRGGVRQVQRVHSLDAMNFLVHYYGETEWVKHSLTDVFHLIPHTGSAE